jgi:hypothetical protein
VAGLGASTAAEAVTHEFIAQRPGENYPRIIYITNKGKVGIGLNASYPRSMLSVGVGTNNLSIDDAGSVRINRGVKNYVAGGGACIGFNAARQGDAAYACDPGPLDADNASLGNRNGGALIWGDVEGTLNFTAFPSTPGLSANNTMYYYANDVKTYRVMKIKPSMQVQIGLTAPPATSTHADYRLAVDGKLVAKSIFVTLAAANWADFVFAPTYALQPLPELEAYLKQNRHLPAIPSAAEVEQNGIDVGEMNARLLQSLEELTLHVIELSKQNARLQAEVAALAAKVNQAATPAANK